MKQTRCTFPLQKRYENNFPSICFDDFLSHDTFWSVITAFYQNGGVKRLDQVEWGVFFENNNGIHTINRGEDYGAVILG